MKKVILIIGLLLTQWAAARDIHQPNIVVLLAYDMGYYEPSIYNRGVLGFNTPNIDRLAREGGYFTNYYSQHTPELGKQAFLTGQSPVHQKQDSPTLFEVLKKQGYQRIGVQEIGQIKEPFFIFHEVPYKALPFTEKNIEFDQLVGQVMKDLDQHGLSDNTIFLVTTACGPEIIPYGQSSVAPALGQRNTYYEARYRVPAVIRWPAVIPPWTVFKDIVSHEDWLPTLASVVAASSVPSDLDGYNIRYYLEQSSPSPRKEFFYWTESGDLGGVRYKDRKLEFMQQLARTSDKKPGAMVHLEHLMIVNQDQYANPYELSDHEPGDFFSYLYVRKNILIPTRELLIKKKGPQRAIELISQSIGKE